MKRDRFVGRYLIKISSSIIIVLLNFVVSFILPRAFSVEQYGFYTFNTNVFVNVVGIANLSASSALASKYTKRNSEIGIVKFYLRFFLFMAAVISIGLILVYPIEFVRRSLGGQTLLAVVLGLEAAILNKLLTDTITIYDSIAVSRFPAFMQIILKICMVVFVIVTFSLGYLNMIVFYVGQAVVFLLIITILLLSFFKDCYKVNEITQDKGWKWYFREFYEFCRPLVLVGIFAQILSIFMDVTLLDNQGPMERAMYGAASQLNVIIVYVFSPYAELSKREYAVRVDDKSALKSYVVQSAKTIMWLTAYFAVFVALMSDKIVPFVFGEKYTAAITAVIIMMGYAIYQSWGQVLGSYLISTEKTKVSAAFSVISQVAMLFGAILFIRPNFIWENGLGAEGMALARFFANLIYAVTMATWIAKDVGFSRWRMNLIHILSIVVLSVMTLVSRGIVSWISRIISVNTFLYIILSGFIYTICVFLLLYNIPDLLGVSKEQMQRTINLIRDRMKNG